MRILRLNELNPGYVEEGIRPLPDLLEFMSELVYALTTPAGFLKALVILTIFLIVFMVILSIIAPINVDSDLDSNTCDVCKRQSEKEDQFCGYCGNMLKYPKHLRN